MTYSGRIYDIVIVSDLVANIVLKKKVNNKIVPVSIAIYGYWKDKALKEMNLKPKDKIKGNLYLKSRLYNGKWYTDVYFKEIIVTERAPVKLKAGELFDTDSGQKIDENTGEIL